MVDLKYFKTIMDLFPDRRHFKPPPRAHGTHSKHSHIKDANILADFEFLTKGFAVLRKQEL